MADFKNSGSSTAFVNPLDKFQSHSIHYIMLACRTTDQAKEFTNIENNVATLEAINRVQRLGDAVEYGNSNNTAFLVMDTRRFSQFTVDRLEYDIFINGLEKDQGPSNFASTVKMSLLDAVGISFANFMQWLMDEKMQTNYDGMVMMLRVLFIGQDENGRHETVQSITIPMQLCKMNLDLTYARGQYELEFMPNVNFDTTRHARWLQIATATTFATTKGSNTLGDIIDGFEYTLNSNAARYYRKATDALNNSGRRNNRTDGNFGRLVQYQITIPEEWRSFTYAGPGTGNATETVFKLYDLSESIEREREKRMKKENAKPEPGKEPEMTNRVSRQSEVSERYADEVKRQNGEALDYQAAAEAGTTIPEVLDRILDSTPQVKQLGAPRLKKGDGGSIKFHKYLTGITSSDDRMTIHVDVIPFTVPNVAVEEPDNKEKKTADDTELYQIVDGKRVPNNYFEFDYIFTGKNIDILDFDLKFENLQWMLASNLDLGVGAFAGVESNQTSEKADTVSDGAKKGATNKITELMAVRPYDPLLPPLNTSSELDNFAQFSSLLSRNKESTAIKATQDYSRNLAMFYASAPIIANMKIRGNPHIMAKFSSPSVLPMNATSDNGPGSRSASSKAAYRKSLEQEILQVNSAGGDATVSKTSDGSINVSPLGKGPYLNSPVFIKVNIKGPNVDYRTAETVHGEDFAKEIIPDAYYVVMRMKNTIEGSSFTQDMTLYSHNIFGNGKIVQT